MVLMKRVVRTKIYMKIYCIDNSLAADIGNLYTIDTMPQGIPFSLYTLNKLGTFDTQRLI